MLPHVTTRPYATQCQIAWPRPGEDFIHEAGILQKTTGFRSFFVIHPDWLSEEVSPPKSRGRARRPWPWEFPGARSTYNHSDDILRSRILSERAAEEERKRHSERQAFQVQHNSPWYVNNPSINPAANSLYHRDPSQPHTLAHNNARRILTAELSKPPMAERLRYGDLSKFVDFTELPNSSRQRTARLGRRIPSPPSTARPATAEEAANFRLMSNSYRTSCDWR